MNQSNHLNDHHSHDQDLVKHQSASTSLRSCQEIELAKNLDNYGKSHFPAQNYDNILKFAS